MTEKLYWPGNSAKTKILRDLLARLPDDRESILFDYGCGGGGDWPAVLRDHPRIRLIGYEPHGSSFARAVTALDGLNAELYTGSDIDTLDCKADYIVSFSVLEHVYDRRHYLQTARRLLADTGLFYLNYDDGHFRNYLDLNHPVTWFGHLKEWLHNLLAEPLSWFGFTGRYQHRVCRTDVDRLVAEAGFRVERQEYSNLVSFKQLQKVMPDELQQDFARLWLDTEEQLNDRFLRNGPCIMGDPANLWTQLGSRTLYLRPADRIDP